MEQDIDLSKRTLIVLIVLSVSISLIGTAAMFYEVSNSRVAPVVIENGGQDSGRVHFTILPASASEEREVSPATGKVALNIR